MPHMTYSSLNMRDNPPTPPTKTITAIYVTLLALVQKPQTLAYVLWAHEAQTQPAARKSENGPPGM